MDKNEKIAHLRQLSKAVDALIEAIENSDPVDDWNYTEEQLLDRSEMLSFREMQLTGRMKFIRKEVVDNEWELKRTLENGGEIK